VEYAGYAPSVNNELNSFSFAAVGSGTKLSYLQAMAGLDDSFEFWGGAADATNLVSYEAGDDHFDMSEGYHGRLQYLIALQTARLTQRTGAGSPSSDPAGNRERRLRRIRLHEREEHDAVHIAGRGKLHPDRNQRRGYVRQLGRRRHDAAPRNGRVLRERTGRPLAARRHQRA
jgi:hypothetical protein